MSGLLCTGQHEDARMCLSVAMTAARMGASLMNHCEVLEVLKKTDENGKVVCCGARLRERFTSMSPTFTYLLFCIPTETHRNLSNKNVPRAIRFITGSGENAPRAIRFLDISGLSSENSKSLQCLTCKIYISCFGLFLLILFFLITEQLSLAMFC